MTTEQPAYAAPPLFAEAVRRHASLVRVSIVNGTLAVLVWLAFLTFTGPAAHLDNMREHWPVALTMAFGSLVGGGTSEGGGAIGFPVLTKVLSVPAPDARLFTFAVQSIGMTCASISILACKVPVERRALYWGIPPAVIAAVPATLLSTRLGHPTFIRVGFTALLTALAIALLVQGRHEKGRRWSQIPIWGPREKATVVITGVLGGTVSALVGVGENTLMFILLVLLFRLSEAIATPTTVILMAAVSVAAFLSHVLLVDSFHGVPVEYWRAAAPICAIGAPLGAWLCSRMRPSTIRRILLALIAVELLSTLMIVPFTLGSAWFMAGCLVVLTLGCVAAANSRRYSFTQLAPNPSVEASTTPRVVHPMLQEPR
ncbi:sulfite exporter TauE/SafE family protein [Actinomycetota bacterium]